MGISPSEKLREAKQFNRGGVSGSANSHSVLCTLSEEYTCCVEDKTLVLPGLLSEEIVKLDRAHIPLGAHLRNEENCRRVIIALAIYNFRRIFNRHIK